MKKKKIIGLMIIFLSFCFIKISFAKTELSKEEIMNIAVKKASALGFSEEKMTIVYDAGNKEIKENTKNAGVSVYNRKTGAWDKESPATPEKSYPQLMGRNYQAIYFGPRERQKGGDLWIFVDKNSGEIITYVLGK